MPVLPCIDLFPYLCRVEELIFYWRVDWLTISCLSQSHFGSIKCWAKLKSCKTAFSPKLSILQCYNNIVSWINIISWHLHWFRSQTVKQLVALESSCTFNVSALCYRHYLPKSLYRIRVSIKKQTALCLQFYVVFKRKHLLHAGPVTSWGVPHSKHWALCKACAKGHSFSPSA